MRPSARFDQVVDVDYYLPGCPPTPKILWEAVHVLLSGNLPPKGTVLAPDRALCDECPRKDTRPEKLTLKEFKRPQDVVIDEQTCMLAQGVVCLGPATRSGCEALCPQGNMPCTGCFGPTSRVRDYGAKALSAIASIIDSNDETEIEKIVQTVPDPVGTFYRYSLPTSMLRRKKMRRSSDSDKCTSQQATRNGLNAAKTRKSSSKLRVSIFAFRLLIDPSLVTVLVR